MRIVGNFQFVSKAVAADGAARVAEIIRKWGASKFGLDSTGSTIIQRTGVPAVFTSREEIIGSATQIVFDVLEPVPGGQLQTQARILGSSGALHFQTTLSLGSDGGFLPPQIDIRTPRFIRDIINCGNEWCVAEDAERLFAKCFEVKRDDVETLWELIVAPQRRFPVILVSELEGETLGGDAHDLISADTCGLAHTCRMSAEASWELTRRAGKEWSCYNGAVRLFWPFRLSRDDYRVHPLWTRDFLMRRDSDEAVARDRFRHELAERLMEASTFVTDDPVFARFEADRARSAYDIERANAGSDFKALADSYAAENDKLRSALNTSMSETETLRQNVESLMIALRSRERADIQPSAQDSPPETVADAVSTARKKLAGTVLFADELDNDIKTLKPSAGPPDKLLRYLLTLGDLARGLQEGDSIGQSIPIWLRERNVECSGESETIKGNKAAKARRTFKIEGDDYYCEYHAKPSDGVSPDLCVRIYFAVTEAAPRIRIGYVGRHFD